MPADWPLAIARGETRRGVFIDTETTGLGSDTDEVIELALMPFEYERDRLGLHALLECARRQLWVVRAEDTAFEQRASLKARGYRWDDGEAKRVKAWWLMTNDPQTELDWLRTDIYGDDRHVTVLKAPATRRYSSRLWSE